MLKLCRIHLENLPENSVAKQCLQISTQLAENKKPSFMSSLKEVLQLYGFLNHKPEKAISTVDSYKAKTVENNLPKIKQNIVIALRNLQIDSIRSNRKLQFYSIFKAVQSSSLQSELKT